jgi:hypothetical protein
MRETNLTDMQDPEDGSIEVALMEEEMRIFAQVVQDAAANSNVEAVKLLHQGLTTSQATLAQTQVSDVMSTIFQNIYIKKLSDATQLTFLHATGRILSAFSPHNITPFLRIVITHAGTVVPPS